MSKGYIVAEVEVTDSATYDQYRQKVQATLAPYGGRFLVRGGDPERLEGDRPAHRVVVLEFASRERAEEWYHSKEYQEILPLRVRAATSRVLLVSGAEPS